MPELIDRLEGIVHEPTQVHEKGSAVDLTVNEIYEIESPGRVDFGGGELTDADLQPHESTKRRPDDEYHWWHVTSDTVLLEFNETLNGETRVLLQPRADLCERGGSHPSRLTANLHPVPLTVGQTGLRIKENARVSTILPI